jgi:hypothetical protein
MTDPELSFADTRYTYLPSAEPIVAKTSPA